MRKYAENASAFLLCVFMLSTALPAKEYMADHCVRIYCQKGKEKKVKNATGEERTYSAYYDEQSGSYKLENHQDIDIFERCQTQYGIKPKKVFAADVSRQESKAPLVAINFLEVLDRIKPNNQCNDAFYAGNCLRIYCAKDVERKIKNSEGHGRVFSAYYDSKSKKYLLNSSEYGAAQIECKEKYNTSKSDALFATDADKLESIAPWVTIKPAEDDTWIEGNPRCSNKYPAKNCIRIYCTKDVKRKLRDPQGHGQFFPAYYDIKSKRYIINQIAYKNAHGVCEKQYDIGESDELFVTDADIRESIAPWAAVKRAESNNSIEGDPQCSNRRD